MPRCLPFIARLRRSRYAGWVAAWLMLLQVIAGAEHLGAMAATGMGAPPSGPFGFLSICSARGLTPPVQTDAGARDAIAKACALCAMDCAAGHAIAPEAGGAPVLPPAVGRETFQPTYPQQQPSHSPRYGTVRGPPVRSAA